MLSYAPWTVATFANDRPLISVETIVEQLDHLEGAAAGSIVADTILGADLISKSGRDINTLTWGVGAQMQRHLMGLWRSGYQLGGQHGWAEMRAAIPEEARSQFALDPATMSAIALLTGEPGLIIPLGVEQAIAARVLQIAGNYSRDILAKIKGYISGATLGELSLSEAIKKELNISKVRAETIARNELTYAYNTARIKVFQQSQLVTHVRFIAILDGRTSPICRSRNGMLIPMSNMRAIEVNRPPLHHRCRSLLSPIMPAINGDHQTWVDDPKRAWDARKLEPLATGWNGVVPETPALQ